MKSNSKLNYLLMVQFGILIGALIVIAITLSASKPELMYFVASSVITLIILAFTWYADKKSNNELEGKIDKIIEILTGTEGKIDGLSEKRKDTPGPIEVREQESLKNSESPTTEKKCWFKAKRYH